MNATLLREIVNAVLYEGYILYPYRASSRKNRRERFTFGRVYPQACSVGQKGVEPCVMQTECLVKTGLEPAKLRVNIGFLHPMAREVGAFESPLEQLPMGTQPDFKIVPELRMGKQVFQPWHEAVEREVAVPVLELNEGSRAETTFSFRFFASRDLEPIRDGEKRIVGMIIRTQETVEGGIEIITQRLRPDLWKLTVRIQNDSPCADSVAAETEALLLKTFASTHAVLSIEGGEFVSLMDTPEDCKAAAANCKNIGTWPVLAGDELRRECDTMLSSPIILYDYPKIAPESAGPLFDGTEIDEILTLRILTMTDGEKLEMRSVDEQARRLLERTEGLPANSLLKMHGTMHGTESASSRVEFDDFFGANVPLEGVTVGDVYLKRGDRVRIRPKARADVMDMALDGQTGVIEAVEQDLEKHIHLALILENDPGKDLGWMRQPGHRFFYGVDEVEPLKEAVQ